MQGVDAYFRGKREVDLDGELAGCVGYSFWWAGHAMTWDAEEFLLKKKKKKKKKTKDKMEG